MLTPVLLMLAPPTLAERKAILDAFRPTVSRALRKKPFKFVVRHLGTGKGWAFLDATIVGPNGKPISFAGTEHAQDERDGMVSNAVSALLRWNGKRWTLIDHALFPTDVPWDGWWNQYAAPRSIFPKF